MISFSQATLNLQMLGNDLVNGYFSQMGEDVQRQVISLYRTWWRESQKQVEALMLQ